MYLLFNFKNRLRYSRERTFQNLGNQPTHEPPTHPRTLPAGIKYNSISLLAQKPPAGAEAGGDGCGRTRPCFFRWHPAPPARARRRNSVKTRSLKSAFDSQEPKPSIRIYRDEEASRRRLIDQQTIFGTSRKNTDRIYRIPIINL